MAANFDTTTLTRDDYLSTEIYALEQQRLFHGDWFLVARSSTLKPGNRRVFDVAGQSVLVARDLDGTIYAHANVCRHRGARLCETDSDSKQGSLMCPYHAWTYALDGRLISTPHLADGEIDRDSLSLWSIAAREYDGFVFVCLAAEPPAFEWWLEGNGAQLVMLSRFGLADLEVARTTVSTVEANWKIIVENYQECLHCTRVHPELVDIIPLYRTGFVVEPGHLDGGARLRDGGNSFALGGKTSLPLLPEMRADEAEYYFGGTVFPNAFVDITGTSAIVTTMFPKGPECTEVVTEYLFAPDTIAAADFDPSPVVDFSELVAAQDYRVCEMVQRGVASRHFTSGHLTHKDELVVDWIAHYRQAMAG
jgi:glycine betaine catabolism A